ncbi:MAG: alpha/beta fold hydrolase [Hydrogenophaga sp.]|nr:alpha/beta fold hydrolase [Hydrogenophaga sp.]
MSLLRVLLGTILLAFMSHAQAQMPQGQYLDGKASKVGVILAHGQGLDADAVVVGPLRRAIHGELGFHTLSLSMPTLPGERSLDLFEEYASTFPDAYARVQAAIDFLKKEKGVERIYLMGHSMGGRMTTGFLASIPDSPVVGFIGVGLLAGGKEPLNTNLNLRKVKVPVIDIYAENDRDAKSAEFRKPMVSDRFVQVPIPGAKHDYRGYESVVANAVNGWLKKQEGK